MYRTATVAIIAFYSKEQLGSNAIKGIIEDEMSNVWVGTGNGLCCINSEPPPCTPFPVTQPVCTR